MKIVIDARMLGWSGIGRYTRALLDNLQALDAKNSYVVIMLPGDQDLWQPTAANFSIAFIAAPPYHPLKEQFYLLFKLLRLKPDVVHFTALNQASLYPGHSVTTWHDFHMLDYVNSSSWRKAYKRLGVRLAAWLTIHNTDQLIVPSRYIRKALLKRYRGVAAKTRVIYEAADLAHHRPQAVPKLLEQPYLLYIGNAYPNKNLPNLVRSFKRIKVRHPDIKLVLVGRRDVWYEQLAAFIRREGVADVELLGYVSDEQLVWLYRHARVYVLPSFEEGFGLQALEAMQLQAPIAASNSGPLPEICRDSALYFNPHDPIEMAQQIERLLTSPKLRTQLIKQGNKRWQQFSWRKMAGETLEVYREVTRD